MIGLFWKLGWRNLFRNKRRSFIAGTAIGLGLASLIFTDAIIRGMKTQMIASGTSAFLGHAQIHAKGYQTSPEPQETIETPRQLLDSLAAMPQVARAAPRVMSFGMLNSPAQAEAVQVVGIDPVMEKHVSMIDESIQKGRYLEAGEKHRILIGSKLADLLGVALNDRIVLTVSEAESGDLSQQLVYVTGIFHFNQKEMDQGMVFIPLDLARSMLAIGSGIHEIAITFKHPDMAREKPAALWQVFNTDRIELAGWPELLPQLDAALTLTDFSTYMAGIILFGVVALSIINTLFMAVHERMFEFGVLRAVGTRPLGVGQLIVYESAALAVLSCVIGSIMGLGITALVAHTGIDYRGIEFAGVTFQSILYPELHWRQFVTYPFWVLLLTVLAGLYPAIHGARLNPSKAIRKSI